MIEALNDEELAEVESAIKSSDRPVVRIRATLAFIERAKKSLKNRHDNVPGSSPPSNSIPMVFDHGLVDGPYVLDCE